VHGSSVMQNTICGNRDQADRLTRSTLACRFCGFHGTETDDTRIRKRWHAIARLLIVPAAFFVFATPGVLPAQATDPDSSTSRSVLVDAAWVMDHVDSSHVSILELGPDIRTYREGHIPGAHFVHWIDDITAPSDRAKYTVAPPEMIEALLCRLGIANSTTIVLYDDLNNRVSARMFWTLRYYGHGAIRILDGGRQAWSVAGHEFVSETTTAQRSEYKIARTLGKHRIRMNRIRKQLGRSDIAIVDGRSPAQYTGEKPGTVYHTGRPHDYSGHIPGAINILWQDNFRVDGTFKSSEELRQLYEGRGVTQDREVITYCNEGLHAAPPWFVLTELLGYDNVRLYDESMAEWANNLELSIKTGDQP
jgi:thiosulfate/3-mercaptopyruvate sulfurtransferase